MKPLNQWTVNDITGFIKSVDKKIWLMIAIGGIGFLLILVFLVIPAWIERPRLRRDILNMETQIRTVQTLTQKQAVWLQNEKTFDALIKNVQERLYTPESAASILGQASKKATESRVEVIVSKPASDKIVFPAPYHSKYESAGYEFTLQGGYHDMANLISRIESHTKLLRVRSFRIIPSDKAPDRHLAELKVWAISSTSKSAGAATAAGTNSAPK